jgi:Flp pilus assembly protein CpaB
MQTTLSKTVTVESKTNRGTDIRVAGGKGMFSMALRKGFKQQEDWLYTDELDEVIKCLTELREKLNTKHEI